MNERRKQGILLLFPVVVLLLGIIFTTTLFLLPTARYAYQLFPHSAETFWKIPLKPSHSYCLA